MYWCLYLGGCLCHPLLAQLIAHTVCSSRRQPRTWMEGGKGFRLQGALGKVPCLPPAQGDFPFLPSRLGRPAGFLLAERGWEREASSSPPSLSPSAQESHSPRSATLWSQQQTQSALSSRGERLPLGATWEAEVELEVREEDCTLPPPRPGRLAPRLSRGGKPHPTLNCGAAGPLCKGDVPPPPFKSPLLAPAFSRALSPPPAFPASHSKTRLHVIKGQLIVV